MYDHFEGKNVVSSKCISSILSRKDMDQQKKVGVLRRVS